MPEDWWAKLRGELFAPGIFEENACLNFAVSRSSLNAGYIEGYRRAAVVLHEHVAETGRDADFLIYPIVFLWRQCVELQLKELIGLSSEIEGGAYEHPVNHHDLVKLWAEVRPIVEPLGKDHSPLDDIGRHLAGLCSLDPNSYAFRFPFEKDLATPSLHRAPSLVGLGGLHDVMSEVTMLLDGCTQTLRDYLDEVRHRQVIEGW
jgi:hypothetical protein